MSQSKPTPSLLFSFQPDLEALLKVTPSLIVVFEVNGAILAANDAAARLFGVSTQQLIGRNIFEIFQFSGRVLEAQVLQTVVSQEMSSFEGIHQGRVLSCILCPVLDTNKHVTRLALLSQDNTDRQRADEQVGILTDELERKVLQRTEELQQANQKLRQEKRRAELLAGFSRVLVQYAYDYTALLQHFSDEIAQQIGDACVIGIFSEGGTELQMASVSHRSQTTLNDMRAALKEKTYPVQRAALGSFMRRREKYIGERLTYEQACNLIPADLWPIVNKSGFKSIAGIPLVVRERVLGGLFVARDHPEPRAYSPDDIAFLQGIAGPLALTIENARLFDEAEQNRQELRGLSQRLVKIQEEQFQRLGQELHDHIGQDLTAIHINLSIMENMLPENNLTDGLRPRLADANRLVGESVAHMRNIMSDFLPPMLDRYGLTAALLWYTQKLTKRVGIPITVNDYNLHDLRLPREVELGLFRIAQEALNNVVKHAQATQVAIELKDDGGHILMTVIDNGVGFEPRSAPAGQDEHWGLAIMRERARAIDAEFSIKSAPGKGAKILLRVPRSQ